MCEGFSEDLLLLIVGGEKLTNEATFSSLFIRFIHSMISVGFLSFFFFLSFVCAVFIAARAFLYLHQVGAAL